MGKEQISFRKYAPSGCIHESVDLGGFIVQNLPDYIFLCGGNLADYDHALRAHFYKQIDLTDPDLFKKIRLAEDADKWYLSRVLYKDLLELEEYVAGLSACILLFLESPGAIAELGVFSQTPNLKEKLVVVIEESFYAEDSFIRHGPIERIEKTMPENVWSYPWLTKSDGKISDTVDIEISRTTLDSVIKDLRLALEKHPKRCKFQHQDHGHRLLLIADLVKLDVACVVGELHKILDGIGLRIRDIPEQVPLPS